MTDYSAQMTNVRLQIVQLRLQGMTLAALVEKGILTPAQAGATVREAATFLRGDGLSETLLQQYQEAFETIATDLEAPRPG